MKLTSAQRSVIRFLKEDVGSIIRSYVSPTGRLCYRLLDSTVSPVVVLRKDVVSRLYLKGALIKEGNIFKINLSLIKPTTNGTKTKSKKTGEDGLV